MIPINPDERRRQIEESIAVFYQRRSAEKARPVKKPTRFKRNKLKSSK